MKKWLFVILFTILSADSYSQSDSDLSRYSYLLVGLRTIKDSTKMIYPIGTCFFARRGKDLFLITAKHCLNGYNGFNLKKTDSQFDTIGFRYYNSKTRQTTFSSLNIKSLKRYMSNEYFFNDADVVVLKMTDTIVERFIYSVEKYFKPIQSIDSLIAYGYGLKIPQSFSSKTKPIYYSGVIADKNHSDRIYPTNDSIYYRIQPKAIQGMSGSPIFIKYHLNNSKKQHLVFGGLLFGTNADFNSAYVINGEVIKKRIMNFH